MRVKVLVVSGLSALNVAVLTAQAGSGYGEFTVVNQTGQIIDLYIDDHYGCRALAGLTCSTNERAVGHTLTAKAADGQATSQVIELDDGGTFTYTISES